MLEAKGKIEQALPLFFQQHAQVHSAAMTKETGISLQDEVLAGLTEDQLRYTPEGMNSIVWLIWHIARTEDVAMNVLVAEGSQVIEDPTWLGRLNLKRHDIGAGMSGAEVTELSAQLPVDALLAYRIAVGRRTRDIVKTLTPAQADTKVNSDHIQQVFAKGALVQAGNFVAEYWYGKRKAFLLSMPATRHCYLHLQHARDVRKKLGMRT
jgi:hypothetical protein